MCALLFFFASVIFRKVTFMTYLPWLIERKLNLFYFSRIKRKIPDFILDSGVLFVHIPKAAGISVCKSLYGREVGHKRAIDYKRAYPEAFSRLRKFSIVRCPYDRVVSAYNFLYFGGMAGYKYDQRFSSFIRSFDSFDDFLFNWLSVRDNKNKYMHFIPQVEFLCHRDVVLVDSVGRLEEIDEYLFKMNSSWGLDICLSKENETKRKVVTRSKVLNNDRLRRRIFDIYRRDFEVLGYDKIPV